MLIRRSAKLGQTLVYMDEPLVITLEAGNSRLIAAAIPSASKMDARFLATTVSKKDWEAYLDGNGDLRYLFTYPSQRIDYYFDLAEMADGKVMMSRIEGDVPPEHLPLARFFSSDHTEEIEREKVASNVEKLLIDGEWDMPDFGNFYNKFSDLYYFVSATETFNDSSTPQVEKRKVVDAFLDRPFKGGFSYVHLYDDLAAETRRSHRLAVDKIKYESPGYVAIHGINSVFAETRNLIENFLLIREDVKKLQAEFYSYLSKGKYLQMSGEQYQSPLTTNKNEDYIFKRAHAIAAILEIPNVEAIVTLVDRNALVFAKVILSLYRRLDDAAKFFAQGRMAFSDAKEDNE